MRKVLYSRIVCIITMFLFELLVTSCNSKAEPQETSVEAGIEIVDPTPKTQVYEYYDPYVDSLSEFILTQPQKLIKTPKGTVPDFKNFTYDDITLVNGSYHADADFGFDTLKFVQALHLPKDIYLITLYHHYGGGSSEIVTHLYVYRTEPDGLTLLSKLACDGNYPIEVDNNIVLVHADNDHVHHDTAKIILETGTFIVSRDGMQYLSHTFSETQN